MKPKVISFSLYGQDPMYLQGALENVRLAREYYPGWICRFYCGMDVPGGLVDQLWREGAEICREAARGPHHGSFWRFFVASDASLERFIVRDTDSRLNPREAAAVAEWEASGKAFHLMRDHPLHIVRRWPILGGMWGGLGGFNDDLRQEVNRWGRFSSKGSDQDFLARWLWPRARKDCLQHHPANFPGPVLPDGAFVGMPLAVQGSPVWGEAGEEPPWITLVLRVGEGFCQRVLQEWLEFCPRPELAVVGSPPGPRPLAAHYVESEEHVRVRTDLVACSRGEEPLDGTLLREARSLRLERSRFLLLGKGVQIYPRGLFSHLQPYSSASARQIPVLRAQSWK